MAPAAPAMGGYGSLGGGGMDEYQKLMADRSAKAKRNKIIFGSVGGLVVVLAAVFFVSDHINKKVRRTKLEFFDRWSELEKRDTASFWNCIMSSDNIDVGMMPSAEAIQQRIEGAYATQQKTFSEHLVENCVPKLQKAIGSAHSLSDMPSEFNEAMEKYKAVLPKLQSGIETYAEKIKGRAAVKDIDKLIQDTGNAFHMTVDPSPESVAFEKFLNCAIPDLQKLKDAQALLEWLHESCFKKDPVAFMNGVREKCGPLITAVDPQAKPEPSKTFKATMKKFYEEEARQLQAWDSCTRKSRRGKKAFDLEEFLTATGDYMEARAAVVKVAQDIAGITPKAEGAEGEAPNPAAAPKPAAH